MRKTKKVNIIVVTGIVLIIACLTIINFIYIRKKSYTKRDLQTDNIAPIEYPEYGPIEHFNDKFLRYEGEEIRGSSVRSLTLAVDESNRVSEQQISITINGDECDGDEIRNKLHSIGLSLKDEKVEES